MIGLGVDLGGTSARVAAVELATGKLLHSSKHAHADRAPAAIVENVGAAIEACARAVGAPAAAVTHTTSPAPMPSDWKCVRVNVTRTIRHAIADLSTKVPELAEHLDESIVTGVSCCYQPLTNIVWTT